MFLVPETQKLCPCQLWKVLKHFSVLSLLSPSFGVNSDSESSGSDEPLHIPQSASVDFTVHNYRPGLHVKTRHTMMWTPIASRTRARMKGTQ